MPRLTLTDFVDIASRAGTPKITKVQQVKKRGDYEPAFDFYKRIREAIRDVHSASRPKKALKEMLGDVTDSKKQLHYSEIIAGYTKWWGKKTITWFEPPRQVFVHGDVEVSVNPELGLEFGGKRHVIKLYFKSDRLTKARISIAGALMEYCLRPQLSELDQVGILDIRNSRLQEVDAPTDALIAGLQAELAYIDTLWHEL